MKYGVCPCVCEVRVLMTGTTAVHGRAAYKTDAEHITLGSLDADTKGVRDQCLLVCDSSPQY